MKRTGLVCPSCGKPLADVERDTPTALTFRCPACGHRWIAPKTRPTVH